MDWINYEAGTLPKSDYVINDKFDEDYFTEIREKKLAILLAQEVIDNDESWTNYEMEEAEAEIDVADMILEHLVVETVDQLIGIERRRKKYHN